MSTGRRPSSSPNLTHPNGMGWSPDGQRLLPRGDAGAADPPLRLRPGHEHARSRRRRSSSMPMMFPIGLADGLAVDTRGHLWVAEFAGSRRARVLARRRTGALRARADEADHVVRVRRADPRRALGHLRRMADLDPDDDPDAGSIFRVEGLGAVGPADRGRSVADMPITLVVRIARGDCHAGARRRHRAGRRPRDRHDPARGVPHRPARARPTAATDSMAEWLHGYPGGWQLLVPNAGPEREHDGVRQGLPRRGRARALDGARPQDETSCELETHLAHRAAAHPRARSPRRATHSRSTDEIANLSPDPRADAASCSIPPSARRSSTTRVTSSTSARTIVTDADAPGSLAAADARRFAGRRCFPPDRCRTASAFRDRAPRPRCSPRSPTSTRPRSRSAARPADSAYA